MHGLPRAHGAIGATPPDWHAGAPHARTAGGVQSSGRRTSYPFGDGIRHPDVRAPGRPGRCIRQRRSELDDGACQGRLVGCVRRDAPSADRDRDSGACRSTGLGERLRVGDASPVVPRLAATACVNAGARPGDAPAAVRTRRCAGRHRRRDDAHLGRRWRGQRGRLDGDQQQRVGLRRLRRRVLPQRLRLPLHRAEYRAAVAQPLADQDDHDRADDRAEGSVSPDGDRRAWRGTDSDRDRAGDGLRARLQARPARRGADAADLRQPRPIPGCRWSMASRPSC